MNTCPSWTSFMLAVLAATILMPSTADLIYDTENHPLEEGAEFYVLPSITGHGGGLTLKIVNETCGEYVAQEKTEISLGLPVVFRALLYGNSFRDGIAVNITTSGSTVCGQSRAWSVGGVCEKQSFITASSATGSAFRIVKEEDNDYVMLWCPLVCEEIMCGLGPACLPLGTYIDRLDNRWVVIRGSQVLHVKFQRATG